MKAQTNRLTFSQQFFIATMLFGLFFGAGNLIFPIFLGSQAGRNVWPAITGLLITGVGIPLLGVAAQGISRSNGLQEMAGRVSPRYSIFFTCALYLTIGPFFAIPRCASTLQRMEKRIVQTMLPQKMCSILFLHPAAQERPREYR